MREQWRFSLCDAFRGTSRPKSVQCSMLKSVFCEKRLYNVESVETAALDVQVIGVDFPTVPFLSNEVERLEYVSPRQWERKRLETLTKKVQGLEIQKPRPKATYRTRGPRRNRQNSVEQIPNMPSMEKGNERNLLKCSRVSLTIQKERESLTTPMYRNPRLGTPTRKERLLSQERPSTSHAALGIRSSTAFDINGNGNGNGNTSSSSHASTSSHQGVERSQGSQSPRTRSLSAKPSGQVLANLPKLKQSERRNSLGYRTRTSQYAERVKAVRKLQVQASSEFSARLSLNLDLGDLQYRQRQEVSKVGRGGMENVLNSTRCR